MPGISFRLWASLPEPLPQCLTRLEVGVRVAALTTPPGNPAVAVSDFGGHLVYRVGTRRRWALGYSVASYNFVGDLGDDSSAYEAIALGLRLNYRATRNPDESDIQ